MIIVTGAAGFIGSALVGELLRQGWQDIVAVDDFSRGDKAPNLAGKKLTARVDRREFFTWLDANEKLVQFIFHLGARTDTTEFDKAVFDELNVRYSQQVWERCVRYGIPLVYASSGATYGAGELGYADDEQLPFKLKPLNPYGESKNEFDKWALGEEKQPFFWAGLKFFNVYGPNEYHKGRMASVVFHKYQEAALGAPARLFRSDRPDYADGAQVRDFVHVDDCVAAMLWLLDNPRVSGLFNVGAGSGRSFLDLVGALFAGLGRNAEISFIDMPPDLLGKYQYFTEAPLGKLRAAGYTRPSTALEEGVGRYVRDFLMQPDAHR